MKLMKHAIPTSARSRLLVAGSATVVVALLLVTALSPKDASSEPVRYSGPELATLLAAQPGASTWEQAVFDDGVVTFEEYELTVERTAACMEAGGVVVERHPGKHVGGTTELVMIFRAGSDREWLTGVVGGCVEQYRSRIGRVWAEQNRLPDAAVAALEELAAECFADAGFPELQGQTLSEIHEHYGFESEQMTAFRACTANLP